MCAVVSKHSTEVSTLYIVPLIADDMSTKKSIHRSTGFFEIHVIVCSAFMLIFSIRRYNNCTGIHHFQDISVPWYY